MRNKRVDGRVKQEFIRYIGKEMNSSAVRRVSTHDVKVKEINGRGGSARNIFKTGDQ